MITYAGAQTLLIGMALGFIIEVPEIQGMILLVVFVWGIADLLEVRKRWKKV